MKAKSTLAGQLSETTTKKFGGNQILAMKICNSLLNKCFHGKTQFTSHSSCRLAGMLCSWAGNARRRGGAGMQPQQIWTWPGGLGREW